MQDRNNDRGKGAEALAQKHLESHGLKTLARNFHTRWGEIDLVMEHDRQVVFVEVRYRRHRSFGGALASVTLAKQRRLVLAATQFLEKRRLGHRAVRFDIVAIEGGDQAIEGGDQAIDWLADAFRPEY